MIAAIIAVCVAVFAIAALVLLVMNAGPSKPVQQRLMALGFESAPVETEEKTANIRREEKISGVAWLNRWMVKINIAPWMRLLFQQAGMNTAPEKLLITSLGGFAAIAVAVYLKTGSLPAAVGMGAVFIPMPLAYVFRRRGKRFAKFEQLLPEVLDMLVSALQVGHSLITAMGALSENCAEPIAGEFKKLFDEQNFGVDLRTAMTNLTVRMPLQDVRIFVAATLIQKESGGNLAEVLSKVAQTTRERFRLKKQIMVHTAQGRLTGRILSLLPVLLGTGMYLINPEGTSVLWTNPTGRTMLYAAAGMIFVGWLIIRKIVAIKV
jgi:tight adherence protein B